MYCYFFFLTGILGLHEKASESKYQNGFRVDNFSNISYYINVNEETVKSGESNIIDIECNDIHIKEVKKITYRDLDIYAVKRSTGYSDAKCALLDITNRAWWCGYVEVPLSIHNLFKPKGYLDEAILSKLDNPNSYNLASVHAGYTYIAYGIPLVLDDNRRMFLGWDYNHCCDTEDCVTYNDIIDEGKRVVDSLLNKLRRSEEKK